MKVTEHIEAARMLIGIKLLDHIVLAKDGCTSVHSTQSTLPEAGPEVPA